MATKNKTTNSSSEGVTAKSFDEKELPTFVDVQNGFNGMLIYTSKRTGETIVWEEFGEVQEMELSELRAAKSSMKDFFTNNWFIFKDDWIYDFLGIRHLYKNTLNIDQFDDIFSATPEKIKKIVAGMNEGQKDSLAYRAIQLVKDGTIDSYKKISALEECLDIKLTDK